MYMFEDILCSCKKEHLFIIISEWEPLHVECVCVCVCVCVVQVYPTLWGQNVPTTMAISKILVRVGTFFGPHEETSL